MGHKDLATTQIYAKVEQQHLRSVVTKLTPLISADVSPKCVTWDTFAKVREWKLLISKEIDADGRNLAERVGFELNGFAK